MDEKKNWSEVPDEITYEIAIRLRDDVDDLIRFGAVCKTWQSMAVDVLKRYPLAPWLMLPEDDVKKEVRKFYCLPSKKIIHNYLPEAIGKRCIGSHLGWLLTVDLDGNINLLNPLTRSHIPLPSPLTFACQDYTLLDPIRLRLGFVTHFAMSSNNMFDGSCIVMVLYSHSGSIAFARPGDHSWSAVAGPKKAYSDITFFKGKFYAITFDGMLRLCDIDSPDPKVIDILPTPEDDICGAPYFYLVEMSGDLHLVVRYFARDENAPEDVYRCDDKLFDVYKLDFESKEWIELVDLHEYAIFVGTHTSFSISTLDYPHLKANSIYFTDDRLESYRDRTFEESDDEEEYYLHNNGGGGRAMGIFDFEEETIQPFYMGTDIFSTFCPPLFFTPRLK